MLGEAERTTMKLEPIKVSDRCVSCKDATALKLLSLLKPLYLIDEDGQHQQVHFRVLDDSIMVWFGDEEPEEATRPREDYRM
jgi:hypothetical protein